MIESKRGWSELRLFFENNVIFIRKVLLVIHKLNLVTIADLVICEKGPAEKLPFLGIQNFLAKLCTASFKRMFGRLTLSFGDFPLFKEPPGAIKKGEGWVGICSLEVQVVGITKNVLKVDRTSLSQISPGV